MFSKLRHINKKKLLKKTLLVCAIGAGLLLLAGGVFILFTLNTLPSLELLENRQITESTKIYDRTGTKLLYEVYEEERRTIVPFEKIPERVKQATIAIEDANFYNHSAIDFRGLLRAILNNITLPFRSGGLLQGGSTITQQLAKKAFLTDDRTPARKIKEAIIAYKLEARFTKDQILTLYLNQIPYGSNAYGIESAAQTFFQKSAVDLTLAESALLASLPQAPSYYSPYGNHVDELMERKDLVLEQMEAQGYITSEEREAASKEVLKFGQVKNLRQAPHFILAVKEYLDEKYGEDFVRRSGLKVITTLDAELQEAAEKAVAAGAKRNEELYKGTNAALVSQDAATGQILAMVGSRDYFDSEIGGQFNVATQGLRQPGSALKPFAYVTALQMGYPPQTVLFDTPTDFNASGDPSKRYAPQNYDERFRGPIGFRSALAQSINIPAVKTLYLVGIDNLLKTLESFGISTLNDPRRYGLSLVLGGGEVHLNELVGAYSVLAQEGVKHKQQMVLRVENRNGEILEEYQDQAQPVMDPQHPRAINDMLSDVQARAPLFVSSLGLTVFPGYDLALKTGTTNDYRDAWAVGYTPSFVTGVWAGNNDNTPMQQRGGSILAAVPILSAYLQEALPKRPPEAFPAPEPVSSDKPMLNGEYTTTYSNGSQTFPQLHSILYYVNRTDPAGPMPTNPSRDSQFSNWEAGVAAWATNNVPGYSSGLFNQPVPAGSVIVPKTPAFETGVTFISPQSGSYITGGSVTIKAHIQANAPIAKFGLYFNGAQVDAKENLPETYDYQVIFTPLQVNAQNTLKMEATDTNGLTYTKEIILYQ